MLTTEQIVYIARKLHWTKGEIGELSPNQARAILKELYYQESVDEWRRQYALANILAAIYNTIPQKAGHKPLTAKDFLSSDMPTREGDKKKSDVNELAIKKGIKIPSK